MSKNVSITVVGLALMFVLNCAAVAQDTSGERWYLGGSLGAASGFELCSSVTPGFTAVPGSCDKTDVAFKIFGGYKFNKYVGAEAGFVWLGTAETSGTLLGIPTTKTTYGGGLEFVGVGTLPLTDKFGLLGKLGGFVWSVYDETDLGFDRDENGVSFAAGAGIKYDITPNVGIRLEWERFWDVGDGLITSSDVDLYTIGALYRF